MLSSFPPRREAHADSKRHGFCVYFPAAAGSLNIISFLSTFLFFLSFSLTFISHSISLLFPSHFSLSFFSSSLSAFALPLFLPLLIFSSFLPHVSCFFCLSPSHLSSSVPPISYFLSPVPLSLGNTISTSLSLISFIFLPLPLISYFLFSSLASYFFFSLHFISYFLSPCFSYLQFSLFISFIFLFSLPSPSYFLSPQLSPSLVSFSPSLPFSPSPPNSLASPSFPFSPSPPPYPSPSSLPSTYVLRVVSGSCWGCLSPVAGFTMVSRHLAKDLRESFVAFDVILSRIAGCHIAGCLF